MEMEPRCPIKQEIKINRSSTLIGPSDNPIIALHLLIAPANTASRSPSDPCLRGEKVSLVRGGLCCSHMLFSLQSRYFYSCFCKFPCLREYIQLSTNFKNVTSMFCSAISYNSYWYKIKVIQSKLFIISLFFSHLMSYRMFGW